MALSLTINTPSGVNVRQGPGTTYDADTAMSNGDSAGIQEVSTDANGTKWYKTGGGWVCGDYVDVKDDGSGGSSGGGSGSGPTPIPTDTSKVNSNVSSEASKSDSVSGKGITDYLTQSLSDSVTSDDALQLYKRRIFGLPHQFLSSCDTRPNSGNLGRIYTQNIISETPVLSILPCKPNYLPSLDDEKKKGILDAMVSLTNDLVSDAGKTLAQDEISKVETKYFSVDLDHVEYMKYVNFLLRSCAVFMGIGDKIVPGTTETYASYRWENYRVSNTLDNSKTSSSLTSSVSEDGLAKTAAKGMESATDTQAMMDAISTENYYVNFFMSPSSSYSESMTNRTEQSQFESLLGKGEGMMKELAFLLGTGAVNQANMAASTQKLTSEMKSALQKFNGGDGILSRLLSNVNTVIAGSNIVFPEIWHESSFDRSYRAEIKLMTPYGDKESIFLNLFVPWMHLLVFVLPKQTSANSYGTPFLIKAHSNKWFSCEMGIIESMETTKGGWTADGFPTELSINISFKDLYSSLMMSKVDTPVNAYMFTQNQGLMEYLSVQCGLDLKKSEYKLKLDLIKAIVSNMPKDAIDNTAQEIRQKAARKAMEIFNNTTGGRF